LTASTRKNQFLIGLSLLFAALAGLSHVQAKPIFLFQQDTVKNPADTVKNVPYKPSKRPTYRQRDRYGDPFSNTPSQSPLFLKDPNKMKLDVDIDTARNYTIYEKIGNTNYRPTSTMSFEEFKKQQDREQLKSYWQSKSRAADGESAVSGKGFTPKIFVSPILDRIFGGSYVELTPRGFVTLDFGASFQRINNPQIPIRQQRNGGFNFDQQINMSVVGKIGEKLKVTANFDNNNSFDFQNNMKVEYTGFKEDILQKLEIGNVSLPLNNTLIQGAQNLFGVKAKLQFGNLNVTAIASTQRGKTSSIDIQGGAAGQGRPFSLVASGYDDNRHFFLGHFFRDNYRSWIANLPQITSGINITRVEVYILNRNSDTQTLRNVVGLMDLGEPRRIYRTTRIEASGLGIANQNEANTLQGLAWAGPRGAFNTILGRSTDNVDANLQAQGLDNGLDYEKITGARKLAATEYTFHKQLGYITLTRKLQNDEALAVAYEYTYNGRSYKVGELSEDYASLKDNEVIYMKLLRPRKVSIRDDKKVLIPTWDLMMKNIYNLNVTQVTKDGFQLRVIYRDDNSGKDNPQLQEGGTVRNRQLVEVMGLDKLNPVNDPQPDGNFDYVEGITINSAAGLIIFPYLEPFNTALREAFKGDAQEPYLVQKYVFDTLYHSTRADAEQFATKNKFWLTGLYSAGSAKEIVIPGFGVSQGSVKVFAGGIALIEGTDYTVDYTFGKVTILNDAILSSGKNISVQYEQSDPFAFQTRSLLGTRLDYKVNDDINIGSTILYYNERPLISRNAVGSEPARNIEYGLDFNIHKNSRVLTKMVDALPFLQTKETSTINVSGEFAQLLPGTSNVINGQGTGYIDDFENTATPYSLLNVASWKLSSVPKSNDFAFDPSRGSGNSLETGKLRAKMAWYTIDNQFYRSTGRFKPPNITEKDLQNHYMRAVGPQEVFPFKNRTQVNNYEQVFDLAYYPTERGPYNYDPNFANTYRAPAVAKHWAGITTAIRTEVDFDKANIEYVEFWMLDPFITSDYGKIVDGKFNSSNTTGGQMIVQLGSISEDVERDSKFAFENGLPPNGIAPGAPVLQTNLGYVTTQQYINNAFDNSPASRANQDVGLDGLTGQAEADFFRTEVPSLTSDNPDKPNDLSSDDFHYFLGGDLDAADAKILQRYKSYNGQDGNSPVITASDVITPSGSPYPDSEDLNADNTLSELEEYYQYNIDLRPGQQAIGKKYIVDEIYTNDANHVVENVHWYLYRIPIREFESQYGSITGFKSIRYMRMILTGWTEPVVLRLVNFRMVGSKWRQYTGDLHDAGLIKTPEPAQDDFTLSVVNLEENAQGDLEHSKSPYTIPPGVVRDRDNTSSIYRQLNEQSVQICIDELKDGDARGIYKNVSLDLFNYGHIKMYFHADSRLAKDGQLYGFLRLGTDFDQNFYEIAVPLNISHVTNPANPDPHEVWPDINDIDLDLDYLYALKAERDRVGAPLPQFYPADGPRQVGKHLIRIFGRPDLSSVQLMMIGARNPTSIDKQNITACVWANELRVTEFNRTPGWAVNATGSAKLADFATINGAMRYTTFGFGAVSSKIGERTRENTLRYDVSANVNVDKLLPSRLGLKIPMFVAYGRTTIDPNYDPANPDMKLSAALKSFTTDDERSAFKSLIRDETVTRSLNFTNVRKVKVKPDAKTHIYDVENLSFSYAYSDALQTNYNIKEALQKTYKGSVAYNFAPKASGIEPFKNIKSLNSPWLKLIKDFNLSLLPSNIAVRADVDRSFNKKVYRNANATVDNTLGTSTNVLNPQNSAANYLKYFTMTRSYNVRWNLSKGLGFEYTSHAFAVIDEPKGDIDTKEKRDTIINNLKKLGRMKNFDQTVTLNYTLPLDKLPITSFLGAEYRYQAGYRWTAGPLNVRDTKGDTLNFGNIIQNNRDNNITGKVDLIKLYNKIPFLKQLNTPPKPPAKASTNNPKIKQPPDTVKTTPGLVKGIVRLLMSLRSINATYTLSEGTILPGFNPSPKHFGMDQNYNAPGWGFVLGSQDPNIRYRAAENGWMTTSTQLTTPFTQFQNKTIDIKANLEPSPDLKIQLNLHKESMTSYQEIFRYDPNSETDGFHVAGYGSFNPNRSGSYKISFLSIKTAFEPSNKSTNSKVFHQFENNLLQAKQILQTRNGVGEYTDQSQDVTIASFLAAYTGKDIHSTNLSAFPKIPLPNWRIDYTGLNKIPVFKDMFQSITLSHAYTSSYTVGNYSNSLQYINPNYIGINVPIENYNSNFYGTTVDASGNIVPIYVIGQVMISEQFAPLIGVNVRTKSRVTANFQYKTKRDLGLNISNAQVTEGNSKDVSLEVGLTKNNMKLPFKVQGETMILKNDVTFRLNITVSDNNIIQRKINEINTVTNGNLNVQIRPNISYVVNQKLNIQAYFERTINDPKVSNSFRRATTRFGIQIRFSLAQ